MQHFHRLKPSDRNAKRQISRPIVPQKFAFGASVKPQEAELIEIQTYFYFDDSGSLFYGENEDEAVHVKASWAEPPKVSHHDVENAFRLGMAVAHISHMEQLPAIMKTCEPLVLRLIEDIK